MGRALQNQICITTILSIRHILRFSIQRLENLLRRCLGHIMQRCYKYRRKYPRSSIRAGQKRILYPSWKLPSRKRVKQGIGLNPYIELTILTDSNIKFFRTNAPHFALCSFPLAERQKQSKITNSFLSHFSIFPFLKQIRHWQGNIYMLYWIHKIWFCQKKRSTWHTNTITTMKEKNARHRNWKQTEVCGSWWSWTSWPVAYTVLFSLFRFHLSLTELLPKATVQKQWTIFLPAFFLCLPVPSCLLFGITK